MGQGDGCADHHPVRGTRRRRQGRDDQGYYRTGEPASLSRDRSTRAFGPREKTEMFMQRYIRRFPAGGEVIIFDRSWYNRAGVEYVMGFCTEAEHQRFLDLCPQIEKDIVDVGIQLIKVWLEVGQDEQERRFKARIDDPIRQWKLSQLDIESFQRWYAYSRERVT